MFLEATQFIVISGIDGCGKTTVINQLRSRLEREGLTTRYEWLRYNHRLVRPVHGLSRLIGLSRRRRVEDRYVWRHEFYRSRVFSSFYITLTWLDAWLGRLILAARLLWKKADVVVCDRWVPDILVDLAVDTRRRCLLRGSWYARFAQILPSRSRQYLVVRDANRIALSRPDVVQDTSRSFRRRLYRRLGRKASVVVVPNNGSVDAAVEAISRNGDVSIYYFLRKDMFLGRWLRHTGYPTWAGRLLKLGDVTVERAINEQYLTTGSKGYLKGHFIHHPFQRGVAHWLHRHNQYSSMEAEALAGETKGRLCLRDIFSREPAQRRRALKQLADRLPCRPALRPARPHGPFVRQPKLSRLRSSFLYLPDSTVQHLLRTQRNLEQAGF